MYSTPFGVDPTIPAAPVPEPTVAQSLCESHDGKWDPTTGTCVLPQTFLRSDAFRTAMYALSVAGGVVGAYHGYKRNDSVWWAFWWSVFGGILPFFALPLAVAQGVGKSKGFKANRGRGSRARRTATRSKRPAWLKKMIATSKREAFAHKYPRGYTEAEWARGY